MDPKNIVIVGGGLVGQTLAARLSSDGHDVTLVEADGAKVREFADTLDVQVIEGNGATVPVLRQAGAGDANLVIASTDSDEVNMVVGFLSAEYFKVPRVVVRVRDPAHAEGFSIVSREHPGQHVIVNTEAAAVDRIADLLEVPGAVDVSTFLDGDLLIAAFRMRADSDLAGLHVSDMRLLFASTPTLVVALNRSDTWGVPRPEEQLAAGDLVYFAIARHELADVLSLVGVAREGRTRIMVGGATPIGLALARRLESRDLPVGLIEEDRELAQRAADELANTLVIHGRVTDQRLLEDEEIERVATFVAVTSDHETNLVAGLLAKRLGAGRALALVDNPALVSLVRDIGIDAIISQRLLAIGLTMHHVRGAGVRSGAALLEDQVEVMEVDVARGSRLASGPLKDVKLPRGVLVAAVRRGAKLFVPRGDDRVEPSDRALLIMNTALAGKVTDFLTPDP